MYFRIADNLGIRYVGTKNDSDDEDDIYGDLGDISLNTEHLDSAESAESNFDDNVQHESKNFSKPNVDFTLMREYTDLSLLTEEMSDALTTTASSFSLASTIGTYDDQTFDSDRKTAQEMTKCKNGNPKKAPHYLQEVTKPDDGTSRNPNLVKVCTLVFHI